VADVALPAPIIELIALAPIPLAALLVVSIALPTPGIFVLPLGRLVTLLVFAHLALAHWFLRS
jgi:hypothetical protein